MDIKTSKNKSPSTGIFSKITQHTADLKFCQQRCCTTTKESLATLR